MASSGRASRHLGSRNIFSDIAELLNGGEGMRAARYCAAAGWPGWGVTAGRLAMA